MKKIMFRTGYLGLGAIEQLAYDIVLGLSEEYEIVLAIENHKNSSLVEKIPKNIKYFYLKSEKFERKLDEIKKKKENFFYKILYNLYLKNEKKVCLNSINDYILKNGKFDLFIDYDGMAMKYAEKININKKIVWQHTALSKEKNLSRLKKRLSKYDKVILICDEMKNMYVEFFPELKDKFERLYNFLDLKRIEKMKEDETELSIEDKKIIKEKYCIKVARLDFPKDFDTLIEAFNILKKKNLKEKLYIIGEGEQRKDITKKIKELKLEGQVLLLGKKKNPYIWMNNADIFVHSSKREGFAAVLLEAMACGKMVISSECPTGPKEVLENGKNGELYPVGDSKSLAQKLEIYTLNPILKEKYILNANNRINDFEKNKILKEYKEFIDKIIS
ncbi:glycosyltransferase [Fusobacterium sp.]|uniref:glycosyltransferase n=1 Tax=Fusobacterium sp. TaxID=68766 RepID=UPI00290034E5|nr:glycosyltransferase [Fusobacterium sp.]MDU1910872.1 glycosyltransferase [Fusobacterium sp.]